MSNSTDGRIDHVFMGYLLPAHELLNTFILAVDDQYPASSIRVVPNTRTNASTTPKLAACDIQIEGRRFHLHIEELP